MTYITTGDYVITLTGGYRCDVGSMFGSTNFTLDVHTDEYEAPIYPKITLQLNDTSNIIEMECEPTDITEGFVYHYKSEGLYFWKDANGQIRSSESNQSGITDSKIVFGNTSE